MFVLVGWFCFQNVGSHVPFPEIVLLKVCACGGSWRRRGGGEARGGSGWFLCQVNRMHMIFACFECFLRINSCSGVPLTKEVCFLGFSVVLGCLPEMLCLFTSLPAECKSLTTPLPIRCHQSF